MRGVKAGLFAVSGVAEIGAKAHEEEERKDLEGQAGNHGIDARLLRRLIIGRCGDSTTDRL